LNFHSSVLHNSFIYFNQSFSLSLYFIYLPKYKTKKGFKRFGCNLCLRIYSIINRKMAFSYRKTFPPNRKILPPNRKTLPPNRKTFPPNRKTLPPNRKTLPPNRKTFLRNRKEVPRNRKTFPPNPHSYSLLTNN